MTDIYDSFLEVATKIVPKSDKQRKRLQQASEKIMILNRLDQVNSSSNRFILVVFSPPDRFKLVFRNNCKQFWTPWKNVM